MVPGCGASSRHVLFFCLRSCAWLSVVWRMAQAFLVGTWLFHSRSKHLCGKRGGVCSSFVLPRKGYKHLVIRFLPLVFVQFFPLMGRTWTCGGRPSPRSSCGGRPSPWGPRPKSSPGSQAPSCRRLRGAGAGEGRGMRRFEGEELSEASPTGAVESQGCGRRGDELSEAMGETLGKAAPWFA